jgi:hypothetical protein
LTAENVAGPAAEHENAITIKQANWRTGQIADPYTDFSLLERIMASLPQRNEVPDQRAK